MKLAKHSVLAALSVITLGSLSAFGGTQTFEGPVELKNTGLVLSDSVKDDGKLEVVSVANLPANSAWGSYALSVNSGIDAATAQSTQVLVKTDSSAALKALVEKAGVNNSYSLKFDVYYSGNAVLNFGATISSKPSSGNAVEGITAPSADYIKSVKNMPGYYQVSIPLEVTSDGTTKLPIGTDSNLSLVITQFNGAVNSDVTYYVDNLVVSPTETWLGVEKRADGWVETSFLGWVFPGETASADVAWTDNTNPATKNVIVGGWAYSADLKAYVFISGSDTEEQPDGDMEPVDYTIKKGEGAWAYLLSDDVEAPGGEVF